MRRQITNRCSLLGGLVSKFLLLLLLSAIVATNGQEEAEEDDDFDIIIDRRVRKLDIRGASIAFYDAVSMNFGECDECVAPPLFLTYSFIAHFFLVLLSPTPPTLTPFSSSPYTPFTVDYD